VIDGKKLRKRRFQRLSGLHIGFQAFDIVKNRRPNSLDDRTEN